MHSYWVKALNYLPKASLWDHLQWYVQSVSQQVLEKMFLLFYCNLCTSELCERKKEGCSKEQYKTSSKVSKVLNKSCSLVQSNSQIAGAATNWQEAYLADLLLYRAQIQAKSLRYEGQYYLFVKLENVCFETVTVDTVSKHTGEDVGVRMWERVLVFNILKSSHTHSTHLNDHSCIGNGIKCNILAYSWQAGSANIMEVRKCSYWINKVLS